MFDVITVSREIEIVDMIEYLKPIDLGQDTSSQVLQNFPTISTMKNEDIFRTLFHLELLFYKNTLKTRAQIVVKFNRSWLALMVLKMPAKY